MSEASKYAMYTAKLKHTVPKSIMQHLTSATMVGRDPIALVLLCGLQTNNPRKINTLEALGVTITERIPCIVEAQEFNRGYLDVKASRMSHVRHPPPPA